MDWLNLESLFDRQQRKRKKEFEKISKCFFTFPLPVRLFRKDLQAYIDYAPTSKAKCCKCKITILKNSPRLWYYDTIRLKGKDYLVKTTRIHCYACSLKILNGSKEIAQARLKANVDYLNRFKRVAKGKKASAALKAQAIMNTFIEKDNSR